MSISEKHGQPVSVTPSDLALLVDGQSVLIRELEPPQDVPLRFLVLIDLSNSNRDKLEFERKVAAQLFEALSKNPNNAGYLGWFTLETRISTLPFPPETQRSG